LAHKQDAAARAEEDSKVYAEGARVVYCLLRGMGPTRRVKLGAVLFYYLPSEEKQTGWMSGPDVLISISRPNTKPQMTKIQQIRAHFCFDFVSNNISL